MSPDRVASKERYFLPYLKVKSQEASIPVVVGVSVKTALSIAKSKEECEEMLQLFAKQNYVLSYCNYVHLFGGIDG